ncbi:hypothetical protein PanWU01x14_079270 [Parasponia andersonii]|uniref:Uncharacterized protein n=1 Tax=Parasponia andersonii TaxID=3476 RepID=A0A2P5DB90_PARAD|nr:hypothetical protein PanWU01x14_079270 [Parasponia andersonii]
MSSCRTTPKPKPFALPHVSSKASNQIFTDLWGGDIRNHDGKASWELLQSLSAPSRTLSENHAIRLLKDILDKRLPVLASGLAKEAGLVTLAFACITHLSSNGTTQRAFCGTRTDDSYPALLV